MLKDICLFFVERVGGNFPQPYMALLGCGGGGIRKPALKEILQEMKNLSDPGRPVYPYTFGVLLTLLHIELRQYATCTLITLNLINK